LEDDKKLQKARNNAYALLRSRPRSEFEVRQRLKLKGYGSEIVETVVSDLRRAGEIDDAKFAHLWVESRMHQNPMGDIVLRRELQEKGVSDSIIEATLAHKAAHYDEFKVAFNIAEERFRQFAKLDKRKAMKRLYDFLIRRGFTFDTVQKIIGELVHDNG
jgi:regulatory protein